MSRLVFDIDGVVGDFHASVIRIANAVAQRERPFSVADITDYSMAKALRLTEIEARALWAGISQPGFALRLSPCAGAVACIARLRENGHSIVFCSAPVPSSPTWEHDRAAWCAQHFPGIPLVSVRTRPPLGAPKWLVRGDWLIDDSPANIAEWNEHHLQTHPHRGPTGILWRRPWNASIAHDLTASDWNELEEIVG